MPDTESKEVRSLYVPSPVVSWEAQVDRAITLALSGMDVAIHRHGEGARCISKSEATPNEWCARIELTPDGEATNVVPVSNTEAETPKDD